MNRKLLQKVIESGVVPGQAVKLMKMWKALPEDLPDGARQKVTAEQLLDFVSEIGDLLENELPELKETMLDVTEDAFILQSEICTVLLMRDGQVYARVHARAMKDAHGCYILDAKARDTKSIAEPGNVIWTEGGMFTITDATGLYDDVTIRFVRCNVSGVPQKDQKLLEEMNAKVSHMQKVRPKP